MTKLAKKNFVKEWWGEGFVLPDFKFCYNTIIIKSVWSWCKNRQKMNGIENSGTNLYIYEIHYIIEVLSQINEDREEWIDSSLAFY